MNSLGAFLRLLFFVSMSGWAFSLGTPRVRVLPLGDSLPLGYSVPTYLHGYRGTLIHHIGERRVQC
jgi:hypothetical protein